MSRLTNYSQMQSHICKFEQYSRRNSIRIFGIQKQTNEKLAETICKFSKQKLNVDLQLHFIDRCHRVGNYQNRNAILVKFVLCKLQFMIIQYLQPKY